MLFQLGGVSPPEPDNSGGDQNYLTWRLTGNNTSLWNDLHAPSSLYFLVEKDVSSASISETDYTDLLNIYPIPSSNNINLASNSNELIEQVDVFTLSGQFVTTVIFENSEKVTLNLSKLEAGQYLLNIHMSNDQIVKKTIIH